MLKELFEAVSAKAIQGASPGVIHWNPYADFAFKDGDGTIIFKERLPATRKHSMESIDDIAQFAKDHAPAINPESANGVCFYNRDSITYFIDDVRRLDFASIALVLSPQMQELILLGDKPTSRIEQPRLIFALRTVFKGCLQDGKKIIEAIRNVKFNSEASNAQEIQRGKSSVGNAIMKQYVGTVELPEYLVFNVPVWEGAIQHSVSVECVFDPDVEKGNFLLQPLPGEIEKVLTKAEQELGRRLAIALGEGYFLYNGTP